MMKYTSVIKVDAALIRKDYNLLLLFHPCFYLAQETFIIFIKKMKTMKCLRRYLLFCQNVNNILFRNYYYLDMNFCRV